MRSSSSYMQLVTDEIQNKKEVKKKGARTVVRYYALTGPYPCPTQSETRTLAGGVNGSLQAGIVVYQQES